MMFEEFFKKKRIDLAALEKAEPALFSEFKTHYELMGEKSFDHTKKYWFNKIRRQYQLAPEIKTEKPHIVNPLAEQTVTESLTETTAISPPAKLGFVPKFKAGNMPKPVASNDAKIDERTNETAFKNMPAEQPVENAEPKPAYVPRFKMKPKKETENTTLPTDDTPPTAENIEAKPAYKPRFNMKNIPPKQTE